MLHAFDHLQIIDERMLEDVNNVLNSGDVPNLYGPEELDRITTACKPLCAKKRLPPTKLNVFAQVPRQATYVLTYKHTT